MSIRPSYGRRSVLQVLSDGMSQRPPTGKSCCEEAALNAAEVDRLTRERDELMALAPAVPSWPEWLGSRPVLRVPVRNVDDSWTFHDGNGCIDGDVSEQSCREAIEDRLADAVKWAGILSAIESEQAATGDEARIEEQAERLYLSTQDELCVAWDNIDERRRENYRAAIRAGWTKEADK